MNELSTATDAFAHDTEETNSKQQRCWTPRLVHGELNVFLIECNPFGLSPLGSETDSCNQFAFISLTSPSLQIRDGAAYPYSSCYRELKIFIVSVC